MNGQSKTTKQKLLNFGYKQRKPLSVATHHIEVVDITPIMATMQIPFHKLVKLIEIDITEQLRSKVSYRQSTAFGTVEQALVVRQVVPIRTVPYHTASFGRIKQDYLLREIFHEIHIHIVFPAKLVELVDAMVGHLAEGIETYRQQSFPVDAHEIASDIHLQHEARTGVVAAFFQDVALEPSYAVVRASAFDTAVAVLDEGALEQLVRVVEIKMMHNAVAEMGGKHLAPLGVGDDKAFGGQRLVGAVPQGIAQRFEILFEMKLETMLIGLVAFVAASVKVGRVEVFKQLFAGHVFVVL